MVNVDGIPLSASKSAEQQIILPPAHRMTVGFVKGVIEQGNRTAVMDLSDTLDPKQNLDGFIRVKPDVRFDVRKKGRRLMLVGAFLPGETYQIHVEPGIRSIWGSKTSEPTDVEVRFAFLKPAIRFLSDGMFLPTDNKRRIRFEATNIREVKAEVLRIFETNLGQYLQRANLDNSAKRNDSFNESDRVAVSIASQKLELDMETNQQHIFDLDLGKLISPGEKGLFLVHLSFDREAMIYDSSEPEGNYYEDPRRPGFIWQHGNIYKAVLMTDIGLSYQRAGKDHVVCATSIVDARPMRNVRVALKSYQNQTLATTTTDSNGYARFSDVDENVFYAEGHLGEMVSVVVPGSMSWNTSTFDTGGASLRPTGIRAFVYPDRGVHRPGDTIHLSLIARNETGSFPDNHPISMKLTNPKRQVVLEEKGVAKKDGFASFTFQTAEDAPTGTWDVALTVGDSVFHHTLPIETVVPYKLKLTLAPETETILPENREWNVGLHADYLFGNPAPGLSATAEVRLYPSRPAVKGFSHYVFDNESVQFKAQTMSVFSGKLDNEGDAELSWKLPELSASPGALEGQLTATVLEKGGRPNRTDMRVPVHPFTRYVGVERPKFKWGYAPVGDELETHVIVVDTEGNPVSGQPLKWTLYHNERSWWWEYRNWSDYKRKYRDDFRTTKISDGKLTSDSIPVPLKFRPTQRGSYLLEVQNGDGHKAAFFFNAYSWGEATSPTDAATISIETDSPGYHPGDTAVVSFPTPKTGTILVSVVKGHQILSAYRMDPSGEERTDVLVPITEAMVPNAYVTISVVQPHGVTVNDRPIRMFGVVNLPVFQPSTKLGIALNMPDELESGKTFKVDIQTENQQPAQFTIAVVDEGLLALTQFKTPDPWKHFFAKEQLTASLADLYGQVISAVQGDPFRVFSIGGDFAMEARTAGNKPEEDGKRRRFKPVALFQGPVQDR